MSPASIDICPLVSHYDVSLAELYARHPGKHLVVGVAIFSQPPVPKLFLLKRAAFEDMSYPNMYEIPCGHAGHGDATILDTIVRETREETGLIVKRVVGEFDCFEYDSGIGPTVQLNFAVEVEVVDGSSTK